MHFFFCVEHHNDVYYKHIVKHAIKKDLFFISFAVGMTAEPVEALNQLYFAV